MYHFFKIKYNYLISDLKEINNEAFLKDFESKMLRFVYLNSPSFILFE